MIYFNNRGANDKHDGVYEPDTVERVTSKAFGKLREGIRALVKAWGRGSSSISSLKYDAGISIL
jgi:hypothetical protein